MACERNLNDWLSYAMIGIGTFFSALNIVVIGANIGSMWKNNYARIMLLIQIFYLGLCIVDIPYYHYDRDATACQVPGAFFYFFWLVFSP